mmetsp:Transcript_16565/g.20246  ORF Transcript_16565/g.20246 Transcript_16565/m.20246 type:complete len:382 (-) Transcript_16565:102-1247(-)
MCQNAPLLEKSSSNEGFTGTSTGTITTSSTAASTKASTSTTTSKMLLISSWVFLTYICKEFSNFIAVHQSQAAKDTFVPAYYSYDADANTTYFDNTILTWGTDLFIGIIMTIASFSFVPFFKREKSGRLAWKSFALFFSYAISVFCGAYAHYTFRNIDAMNTTLFRVWWTLCVGSVTAAGGFMGMIGSEVSLQFQTMQLVGNENNGSVKAFPWVHDILWFYFGSFMTYYCIIGELSYARPACDIFVAGATQFIPTVSCELAMIRYMYQKNRKKNNNSTCSSKFQLQKSDSIVFMVGFVLNAQLLPSYPCLVQYTDLSLGVINALLHLNLTVAWSMQARGLYQICKGLNMSDDLGLTSADADAGVDVVEDNNHGDGGKVKNL